MMEVINNHTIKINLNEPKYRRKRVKTKARLIAEERRAFLHKKLGSACMDCKKKVGNGSKMNIHHIFYPLGFSKDWWKEWRKASEDVFWEDYYPEIMESCILLCRECHKKRHGIKNRKDKAS